MTDKYKDLRDALAAGPTPGPWRAEMVYDAGYAHINFDSREWNTLRGFCGEANAKYIAAANPETIRDLLADRDALADAAQQAIDMLGPKAPECCGCEVEWNAALSVLRAALAQEQGGSDDT